jgi:hypothetical protein
MVRNHGIMKRVINILGSMNTNLLSTFPLQKFNFLKKDFCNRDLVEAKLS